MTFFGMECRGDAVDVRLLLRLLGIDFVRLGGLSVVVRLPLTY